ncbi:MAG: Arc family DNA-binding protein [Clostridia bacterium]
MGREQTTLRLPTELLEQIRRQAQERGDSFNETVIRYLLLGLEAESKRETASFMSISISLFVDRPFAAATALNLSMMERSTRKG